MKGNQETILVEKACAFCQIADIRSKHQGATWDTVLFESANFVAIPSIGSIVEGWLLIVTKRHYLCMGALNGRLAHELLGFKDHVQTALQDCYGQIATFEHGPSQEQQAVGCGVDHAHLHLVPTEANLTNGLFPFYDTHLDWKKVEGIHNLLACYASGKSYLYVEQGKDGTHLLTDVDIKSQSFRRVVANHVGLAEEYNWREYPCLDKVASTVRTMQDWKLKQAHVLLKTLE